MFSSCHKFGIVVMAMLVAATSSLVPGAVLCVGTDDHLAIELHHGSGHDHTHEDAEACGPAETCALVETSHEGCTDMLFEANWLTPRQGRVSLDLLSAPVAHLDVPLTTHYASSFDAAVSTLRVNTPPPGLATLRTVVLYV